MANFCCSIETEPRTLKQDQLSHVREIAVDIVQKKESDDEEGSSIFNKGVNSIVSIEETAAVVEEYSSNEKNCQCSFSALVMDTSPEECRVKEPLSAPF
ncbi:hypothetical protein ACP275_04G100600 [Erythranthe tilingii]